MAISEDNNIDAFALNLCVWGGVSDIMLLQYLNILFTSLEIDLDSHKQ